MEKKNKKIVKKHHFISWRLRFYADELEGGYEEKIIQFKQSQGQKR